MSTKYLVFKDKNHIWYGKFLEEITNHSQINGIYLCLSKGYQQFVGDTYGFRNKQVYQTYSSLDQVKKDFPELFI